MTAHKLHQNGIRVCHDLQQYDLQHLRDQFGKSGERFYSLCRGLDERLVEPNQIRRSLSVEQTFPVDLINLSTTPPILKNLFQTCKPVWHVIAIGLSRVNLLKLNFTISRRLLWNV